MDESCDQDTEKGRGYCTPGNLIPGAGGPERALLATDRATACEAGVGPSQGAGEGVIAALPRMGYSVTSRARGAAHRWPRHVSSEQIFGSLFVHDQRKSRWAKHIGSVRTMLETRTTDGLRGPKGDQEGLEPTCSGNAAKPHAIGPEPSDRSRVSRESPWFGIRSRCRRFADRCWPASGTRGNREETGAQCHEPLLKRRA